MNLALTLHDPNLSMFDQAVRVLPTIRKLFKNVFVAATNVSVDNYAQILKINNIKICPGGLWNEGRISAIKSSVLSDPEEKVALFDFDKLLHIGENNLDLFTESMSLKPNVGTLLGRNKRAWETYPESWKKTESIVNIIANNHWQTQNWDYMVGAWILPSRYAKTLIDKSKGKNFDAALEYEKIFIEEKMPIDYLECDYLDWEDADRNQELIKNMGYDKWKMEYFESLMEWKRRIDNLYVAVSIL